MGDRVGREHGEGAGSERATGWRGVEAGAAGRGVGCTSALTGSETSSGSLSEALLGPFFEEYWGQTEEERLSRKSPSATFSSR